MDKTSTVCVFLLCYLSFWRTFPKDYYGDTFFQSAGSSYVILPSFFNESLNCISLTSSLDPYAIQAILGAVSVLGTIPALVLIEKMGRRRVSELSGTAGQVNNGIHSPSWSVHFWKQFALLLYVPLNKRHICITQLHCRGGLLDISCRHRRARWKVYSPVAIYKAVRYAVP